jgi:excinuclease UvrABC nuclease subunit
MVEYTIYGLKDPTDNIIKYVGVSKNVESRYKQHFYVKHNETKFQWISKLKEVGLRPELIKLEVIKTSDRNEALNLEREYIKKYKDTIYNLTGFEDKKETEPKNHTIISITEEIKAELDTLKKVIGNYSYDVIITQLIIEYWKNKNNSK